MQGATINLLLILNSASTMLKRAPPEIVWVMLSPSGRGIPLRAGSPRCCNERRPGYGSPHPPAGVRRSAPACSDSPKRSGLARAAAANTSGAPPQGRVFLALTASIGLPRSGRRWKGGAEGRRQGGTHDRGGLADPLLRAS